MKESAPTPYLRASGNADKRLQDMPTMELLCDGCENRFSAWETKFAKQIFHPKADGETTFTYRIWLLKFATSLTWRAIQFHRFQKAKDLPALNSVVDGMELHLSRFLLGQANNVGPYTQHIYPVAGLAAPVRPGSPMLNRYLTTGVELDLLRSDDLSEMMVYIKLPMFMFFSLGTSKYRTCLETSRIKKRGLLHPKSHELPESIFDYLLQQSDRMGQLFDSMSPQSRAAADRATMEAIEQDPDRVVNSRLIQALSVDYQFYGKDAVVYRD